MADRSVVIIGLPESGKTTFLAALWHLVTSREIETVLRLTNLRSGDLSHLNAIAAQWRDARVQERTGVGGNKLVAMNLHDASRQEVQVTFPDVAGEAYRRMWEERICDQDVADALGARGVLFFVHADAIRFPQWVQEQAEFSRQLGLPPAQDGQTVIWHPRLAPTQVQVVGLLQLLREVPLDIGPRRLAIMLSAWDKVAAEGHSPAAYLREKLPMLEQYLRCAADGWDWRVYGLSAQGGEYDSLKEGVSPSAQAQALRDLDAPSKRIKLLFDEAETHDLTEPLSWLME